MFQWDVIISPWLMFKKIADAQVARCYKYAMNNSLPVGDICASSFGEGKGRAITFRDEIRTETYGEPRQCG